MRIVFVNLHCNAFMIKPLSYFINGRPCTCKHFYLLKYLISEKKKMAVYINDEGTSLSFIKKYFNHNCIKKLEFYIAAILNGINPFHIEIISNSKEIRKDDVVFGYLHYPNELKDMNRYEAFKLLHFNHFHTNVKNNLKLISRSGVKCFVAEANLKKHSELFKQYYSAFDCSMYVLPYVFQNRFKRKVLFHKRKNKAIATGTYCFFSEDEFFQVYQEYCLHPMRKKILDNKDKLKDYIDSYISDFNEKSKEISTSDGEIIRLLKEKYNEWSEGKGRQEKYFSFNIVDKYNEYKMCIVPEEVTGLPAIGFVEAMACGCAFIGIEHPMYIELGLTPGIHYISYDGSLEDLKNKITYYQKNQKELEKIADRGYKFVRKYFNQRSVAEKFYEDILQIFERYMQEKENRGDIV